MIKRTRYCYEVIQYDDAERYIDVDDTGTSLRWRSEEGNIDVSYGWVTPQQTFTAAGSTPLATSFTCLSTQ